MRVVVNLKRTLYEFYKWVAEITFRPCHLNWSRLNMRHRLQQTEIYLCLVSPFYSLHAYCLIFSSHRNAPLVDGDMQLHPSTTQTRRSAA